MITPTIMAHVLGARGIDPTGRNTKDFSLVDRLDGLGIQIQTWEQAVLGPIPSESELALAATPKISMSSTDTASGFIATAALDGGTTQVINWRCIAPDGTINTDSGAAVAGSDAWEIDGPPGRYIMQAWAAGFGFAELEIEN